MLVLTRKAGESILIGEGIVITVIQVGRNRVRLGFDAPGDLAIRRMELDSHSPTHGKNYGSIPTVTREKALRSGSDQRPGSSQRGVE
ncbi:carbon storage regulator [Planctomicrobium piriforme]|uniref:Translational regulator CsrA n=2 Tax=Planctomicrobium piriforme TaxID=1576369 RepID=A0A1I3EIV9_9PLAN|nr:carbon storage regulator [Planctomicrobium piriforme]